MDREMPNEAGPKGRRGAELADVVVGCPHWLADVAVGFPPWVQVLGGFTFRFPNTLYGSRIFICGEYIGREGYAARPQLRMIATRANEVRRRTHMAILLGYRGRVAGPRLTEEGSATRQVYDQTHRFSDSYRRKNLRSLAYSNRHSVAVSAFRSGHCGGGGSDPTDSSSRDSTRAFRAS